MISFVKPEIPLGKNIHCRTFTKGFFEKIAFEPNKENLINNLEFDKEIKSKLKILSSNET